MFLEREIITCDLKYAYCEMARKKIFKYYIVYIEHILVVLLFNMLSGAKYFAEQILVSLPFVQSVYSDAVQ